VTTLTQITLALRNIKGRRKKERKRMKERKKERKRKPAVRAFGSEPRELVPAVVIAVAWNAS
jgi:hypothetical protein